MTEPFYITMPKGAQAAADALGVHRLFQGAPRIDPERQVSVLDADSFHQVERLVDKTGAFLGDDLQKERRGCSFSVASFYSLEYNLALTKLHTPQTMNPPSASQTPGLKTPATIVAASIATRARLEQK